MKKFISRRYFSTLKKKTGFIGLGQMGSHMASNLLDAGHEVHVFDLLQENVDRLVSKGAKPALSPQSMVSDCSTIMTMLPSTPHVLDIYCDVTNGILSSVSPGTLLIDSSTIEPSASKQITLKAGDRGAMMVDAPVSGGVNGAAAGTLTFMVGGSSQALERATPILKAMGKNIVHCGDSSMGQVAKLCNNLALAIEMAGVSEAMSLGTQLGIEARVLAGIMNTSTSQCWSSSSYNPYPGVLDNVPSNNDYEGGFASILMRKDLGLALDAAKSVNAAVPFTATAHQLYNLIVAQGAGRKDFGVILKFLQGRL